MFILDLLKHKAQPEAAADGIELWVQAEREMRERLQREKEARETREKALVRLALFAIILPMTYDLSERNVGKKPKRRIKSRKRRRKRRKSLRN